MYQAMNYADSVKVGVIKSGDGGFSWAVEPEWNWAQAQRMAAALYAQQQAPYYIVTTIDDGLCAIGAIW